MIVLDPLMSAEEADGVLDLWRRFPSYGLYSNEGYPTAFAPELAQRYDAAVNFVRTGGRFGRKDADRGLMAARTNYFRETYAYGDDVAAPGIELFMHNENLLDAARRLHGREVIEPAIGYANIMLPGQELATHTDVPEFRGANRKVTPEWLLVVMHHSGLFDRWRMPIATGISYFGGGRGGELAYYPDGAAGEAATYAPCHNTAVVLDTDSVFHGVDRVLGDEKELARIRHGMRLFCEGDGSWTVRDGDDVIGTYDEDQIRLSISWKAYCFTDEAERDAWRTNTDDLSLDTILTTLVDDLVTRGRLIAADDRPLDAELGRLLIDEYVKFPSPTPA
ncbi:MAG: hypothetical protein JO248_06900 [Acidimicrobiia bacterium]|nr:hypothetical protein [Acidimicrobiia bacterium]